MNHSVGQIIRYIQQTLFEGREPNEEGYYLYTRRELSDGAGISPTTFDNNKKEVIDYFMYWWSINEVAHYTEYPGEILYIDVKYEKGKFMFKRNPLTFEDELKHLWGNRPGYFGFCYEVYDKQHRQRHNYPNEIYHRSIPWGWTEEQIEEALKNM